MYVSRLNSSQLAPQLQSTKGGPDRHSPIRHDDEALASADRTGAIE
jgi:hypothetical protein